MRALAVVLWIAVFIRRAAAKRRYKKERNERKARRKEQEKQWELAQTQQDILLKQVDELLEKKKTISYGRQLISITDLPLCNTHNNLVSNLHINCFITVKIYLYYHLITCPRPGHHPVRLTNDPARPLVLHHNRRIVLIICIASS